MKAGGETGFALVKGGGDAATVEGEEYESGRAVEVEVIAWRS